jgi:uncharacterized protein with HEPN domain
MSSDRRKPDVAEIIYFTRRRIARSLEWIKGESLETYAASDVLQAAVERNFIAIGEAMRDLSRLVDLTALDPQGPWREPIRFRDFLAHSYMQEIEQIEVLKTVTRDLPVLDEALARIEPLVGGPHIP